MNLQKVTKAIGNLQEDIVLNILMDFASKKPNTKESQNVVDACQRGMAIARNQFTKGEYSVKDLILAEKIFTKAITILKPLISDSKENREIIVTLAWGR